MVKKEELIYATTLKHVEKFELDSYHKVFLSAMVARKIMYPEEIDHIAGKVMEIMPKIYNKKDLVRTSKRKCLEKLEEALNEAKVPEEWLTGKTVNSVVKELVQIVQKEVDEN